MAKFPDSVSVPIAVPGKSRKFYTQRHITTASFMSPRPIFAREYVPERDMTVKTTSFVRANPMPVPIFGSASVHNRAFFVPFRTIFPMWNEFISNTIYNNGTYSNMPTSVPILTNKIMMEVFTNSPGAQTMDTTVADASSADIVYREAGTIKYGAFMDRGIHYLSILESLGYKIHWNNADNTPFSALPLLAFAKVMIDWYYPSAYVGSQTYNTVQGICNYQGGIKNLNLVEVLALLSACERCTYDNDYFVNAWDQPIGPNGGIERSLVLTDVTSNASVKQLVTNDPSSSPTPTSPNVKPSNNTPFIGSNGGSNQTVNSGVTTQYVINALRSMTDFTLRHRIAGVRALDRYLLEYGVNLSDEIMRRSMYLGSQTFDMEFYDVFSHASTATADLGDFAGKGTGFSGEKAFHLSGVKEFGIFIIVNSIMPHVDYFQGQSRETMHLYAMDFYHPDYDHMMVQPISNREIYVTQNAASSYATPVQGQPDVNDHIFGYTSKYIEYNIPMSVQSGLYRSKLRRGLLPCYSLMRDLSYLDGLAVSAVAHSIGFVQGEDANQYNRIFYASLDPKSDFNEDMFNCIHKFEVTNIDSTLQPYESFDFEHNNDKVDIQVNGSKLN